MPPDAPTLDEFLSQRQTPSAAPSLDEFLAGGEEEAPRQVQGKPQSYYANPNALDKAVPPGTLRSSVLGLKPPVAPDPSMPTSGYLPGQAPQPREATWGEAFGAEGARLAWNSPVVGNINRALHGIPQDEPMPVAEGAQPTLAQNVATQTVGGLHQMAVMAPLFHPAAGLLAGAAGFGLGELGKPEGQESEGAPFSRARLLPAAGAAAWRTPR